ncbi:MAG: 16S rRNA (guanine(527)-N(7))-methyltransferase RsmG [Thermoleophilia bacterium]|nr:16S rRNA (guanine(527)-N(7))-methyltransferase RsmG [Thermoleophilia bacterium]
MGAPEPAPAPIKTAEDFARAFDVSRETLVKLQTYADLLAQWQKTINLVAPSTLPDVWSRHFADSAQLLALAPPHARRWLDLGSGAGFPGLVLALMLAPRDGARVALIESDTRKAAFLAEVARRTGAPVDIYPLRIEQSATQAKLGAIDVITARALAPLPRLLELAAPYFSTGTVGLFLKGREAHTEVEAARATWDFTSTLEPSLTDSSGRIVVIHALKANTEGAR